MLARFWFLLRTGVHDVLVASQRWRFWSYLAWLDIKLRYKRSVIGPWWITLSMLIMVSTMGVVYGRLFKQNIHEYLPFLICGTLFWIFISGTVVEGCEVFKNAGGFIKQIHLPFSLYLFRLVLRNLIILAHNAAIYVVVALIFSLHLSWHLLLLIPGLLLVVLNVTWVSLLVGLISTRYRDTQQIIASLVQVTFFISPIAWMPTQLGHSIIVQYNPVFYLLDLSRSPLLEQVPMAMSWYIMSAMAVLGCAFSLCLLAKYRRRIPFWID